MKEGHGDGQRLVWQDNKKDLTPTSSTVYQWRLHTQCSQCRLAQSGVMLHN